MITIHSEQSAPLTPTNSPAVLFGPTVTFALALERMMLPRFFPGQAADYSVRRQVSNLPGDRNTDEIGIVVAHEPTDLLLRLAALNIDVGELEIADRSLIVGG